MKKKSLIAILLTAASVAQLQAANVAVNGGFETGDFTDWQQFPSAAGQQNVINVNPSEGSFAAEINNTTTTSASLIKNANVGIGFIGAGESVTITFDARGAGAAGGVAFAEFFSELSGGGTSSAEILGGGPLALDPDVNTWKSFSFTTTTGPDVSGGVTLQFNAVTGGAQGSTSLLYVDNVKIDAIPEPASLGLLALSGLLFGARRRR